MSFERICYYCEEEISEEEWQYRHSVKDTDRSAHVDCCEKYGYCAVFFSR